MIDFIIGFILGLIGNWLLTPKDKKNCNNSKKEKKITYIGNRPMFITEGGHTYPHPDNPHFKTLDPSWGKKKERK